MFLKTGTGLAAGLCIGALAASATAGGGCLLDFGVTPDDTGATNACTGAPIEITTQYVQTRSIVFGTAVDKPDVPVVSIRTDGACDPTCRSAGGIGAFDTDWWCQFKIGIAPGVPGLVAGVTSFSAELCSIEAPIGTVLLEGYDRDCALIATASTTVIGTETLTIFGSIETPIAFVRIVASDPARLGGVSVDCLNYDTPFVIPCGQAGSGSCFFPNDVPGCDDADCCTLVCADDPFCCETEWDDLCADAANMLCANEACPGTGDCFVDNGTPGCGDATCCNAVCSADPFCCEVEWDSICATEAEDICPREACCFYETGTCSLLLATECQAAGGAPQGMGTTCENTPCFDCPGEGSCFVPNATPGCDDETCCATVCASDPFCCETQWDGACAADAVIACGIDACPGEGDCLADTGTPGCADAGCCNAVCAMDAFCCEAQWDSICATQADLICAGGSVRACCFDDKSCLDLSGFDCTAAGGTPQDAGSTCEGTVCPPTCGSPTAGNCFVAGGNGTPACEDLECCELVCMLDPFCCTGEWDDVCADQAVALCCPADCAPVGGDGTVNVTDLLAVLAQWNGAGTCDVNRDGIVNVTDLLAVLGAWGDCP